MSGSSVVPYQPPSPGEVPESVEVPASQPGPARCFSICSGWNPRPIAFRARYLTLAKPVCAEKARQDQYRVLKSVSPGVAMWDLPPTGVVLYGLSLLALAAQAMAAALAAGRRSMDWVGVCLLGCITALGGGTIRDVLLGHYPLLWVQSPSLLALTAGAAFATLLIARAVYRLSLGFLVLDAIGLVVFTMAGCDVAWQINMSLPIVIVSGMITGCAGGVLRDILCKDVYCL